MYRSANFNDVQGQSVSSRRAAKIPRSLPPARISSFFFFFFFFSHSKNRLFYLRDLIGSDLYNFPLHTTDQRKGKLYNNHVSFKCS